MSQKKEVSVSDMKDGSKKLVSIDGHQIALFCIEGDYYAIEDTCSHAEASLSEGYLDGYEIECPLHGARFDVRNGDALSMPAFQGVKTYPVTKNGDTVYIEI